MADNSFGKTLQNLIKKTGLKNLTVAQAVGYDVSYISKWISGKLLPAEKNLNPILKSMAQCIAENAYEPGTNPPQLSRQWRDCGCPDAAALSAFVEEELYQAYINTRDNEKSDNAPENAHVYAYMQALTANELIKTNPGKDMLLVCDLLALGHENRLIIAGIENGHFSLKDEHSDVHMSFVMNIDERFGDDECIYDSIFLIHMLTGMSKLDFDLYNSASAAGRLIYIADDKYALSGMHISVTDDFAFASELTEFSDVLKAREIAEALLGQESLVFRRTTMQDMIAEKDYVRSMISTNVRWLLGHMTELILPENVFGEICTENTAFFETDTMRELRNLSAAVAAEETTRIMIYESALALLASTGELDFFNHRVILNVSQRRRCLQYLKDLIAVDDKERIKLVDGGFSEDFQYITNPCVFLSDTVCYVRLENNLYKNNILLLNDRNVKSMLDGFYDGIWNRRRDVVISDKSSVLSKVEHYIKAVDYFG